MIPILNTSYGEGKLLSIHNPAYRTIRYPQEHVNCALCSYRLDDILTSSGGRYSVFDTANRKTILLATVEAVDSRICVTHVSAPCKTTTVLR